MRNLKRLLAMLLAVCMVLVSPGFGDLKVHAEEAESSWNEDYITTTTATEFTKVSSIENGAKYLIVTNSGSTRYALRTNTGSSNTPQRQEVTVSNGKVTPGFSNQSECLWTITRNNSGSYTVRNGNGKYIYMGSSNVLNTSSRNLSINSNSNGNFSFEYDSSHRLNYSTSSPYYSYGSTAYYFALYKYTEGGTAYTTQTNNLNTLINQAKTKSIEAYTSASFYALQDALALAETLKDGGSYQRPQDAANKQDEINAAANALALALEHLVDVDSNTTVNRSDYASQVVTVPNGGIRTVYKRLTGNVSNGMRVVITEAKTSGEVYAVRRNGSNLSTTQVTINGEYLTINDQNQVLNTVWTITDRGNNGFSIDNIRDTDSKSMDIGDPDMGELGKKYADIQYNERNKYFTAKEYGNKYYLKIDGSSVSKTTTATNLIFYEETTESASSYRTNLEELQDLITEARNLNDDDYTDDSYAAVTKALGIAEGLNHATNNMDMNVVQNAQEAINDAAYELAKAISELQANVKTDKTALRQTIATAKAVNEEDYTAGSVEAMKAVLAQAEAVNKNNKASQEEIDAATEALADALGKLDRVDKSELRDVIAEAEAIVTSRYTESSVAAMLEALAKAKQVEGNRNANQKQVDKAKKDLLDAIAALDEKDLTELPEEEVIVDPEANKGLLTAKNAKLEDDGTYTITLEAMATGEVKTTTTEIITEEAVPTDIIMIFDQSGSMKETMTTSGYYQASVKNSALTDGNYYYKDSEGNYHKISVKKTLSGNSTTVYKGADNKTYTKDQLVDYWTDSRGNKHSLPAGTYALKASLHTFTLKTKDSKYYYVDDDTKHEYDRESEKSKAYSEMKSDLYKYISYSPLTTESASSYAYAATYLKVTESTTASYTYTYYMDNDESKVIMTTGAMVSNTWESATVPFTVYEYRTAANGVERYRALASAAREFVEGIRENAVEQNVDHRIAIVGFAGGEYYGDDLSTSWSSSNKEKYYYCNTELLIGDKQYNLANKTSIDGSVANDLAPNHYHEAFQSVLDAQGYANLLRTTSDGSDCVIGYHGPTMPHYGFDMTNDIFETYKNDSEGRNRIVIFLTDGEPEWSQDTFSDTLANKAKTSASTTKTTYGATIYSVAVLDSRPADNSKNAQFLKAVATNGDYTLASNGADLTNFFKTVQSTITNTDTTTTTNVTLSKSAELVDEMSAYFTFPEGIKDENVNSYVSVGKVRYEGGNSFSNTVEEVPGATVTLRYENGKPVGVAVSGFDYSDPANWVYTDANGAHGYKLVVTIKGILAKDEAATGELIDTNKDSSGVYDTGKNDKGEDVEVFVKPFNMPQTVLAKKLYVLDYAKKTPLDVYASRLVDSADDKVFSKVTENDKNLTGKFGKITTEGGLSYTPVTMKWDGYDTFYALGKTSSKNVWTKVSVLPANNVFFEDSFETITYKDGSTNGIVGIEYTGDWTVVGTEGGQNENANGPEHGWEEALSDDSTYSDGSAHKADIADGKTAKASFTFTGTGVDVYTRTNASTGVVMSKLFTVNGETIKAKSFKTSDNLAMSGDYYQIPTLTFTDLPYGTYQLELVVSTGNTTVADRTVYYIDGIRVYNPMNKVDEVVNEAYKEEVNASFEEVRSVLLDNASLEDGAESVTGAVFIDYNGENTEVTAEDAQIATYVDYGPKHEVYLAKDQAIAMYLGDTSEYHVAVGLKGPEGVTTAEVSFGDIKKECDIKGASDLYYEVNADENGFVIIKNTGDNLLSVTKLKKSGTILAGQEKILGQSFSINEMLMAARFFSLMPMSYEEPEEEETPSVEESQTLETEITEPTEPETGEVIIENPEPETETETETQPPKKPGKDKKPKPGKGNGKGKNSVGDSFKAVL